MTPPFNAAELIETACMRSGLRDFGPGDFRTGLELFVKGLNTTATIAEDRRDTLRNELLRLLLNRLYLAKDMTEHPEIVDERIVAPVVINSLPRTGTTKLHRMLAASGAFQTAPMWQGREFARIPGQPDGGVAERIEKTRAYERWRLTVSPELRVAHPTFTEAADEELLLKDATFCAPVMATAFDVPDYSQWFAQQDMQPVYDYLLLQLKYLQWQSGEKQPRTWLLKSPCHFGYEECLARTFPDMRMIVAHRDPVTCVPSVFTLVRAARKLYSDRDSSASLGPMMAVMFSEGANRQMLWRDAHPDVPVLDLAYRDIEHNDTDVARAIFAFVGKPLTPAAEAAMQQWSLENRKDKHGVNRYSINEAYVAPETVAQAFTAYSARFQHFLN